MLDAYTLRFEGACGEHSFSFDWPIEFVAGGCRIPIAGAQLWQPRGYGQPNLYVVTTQDPGISEPYRYGTALVLIGLVLIVNISAVVIRTRFRRIK